MAAGAAKALAPYWRKRDFSRTPEPRLGKTVASRQLIVQQHYARNLHFDLRLEIGGVLVSWAVTKGPSANPRTKRLAVRTEDHPLAYGDFEGTIPKGQYGGGTVILWEHATYVPLNGDPAAALAKGEIKFESLGARLCGRWVLVRMKNDEARENWLLIKERDEFAEDDDSLAGRHDKSVVSSRSKAEIEANKPAKAAARTSSNKKPIAMPEFVAPQLCEVAEHIPTGSRWAFELKYDGYRVIIAVAGGGAKIFTRSGLDWTRKFPHIARAASVLRCKSALLDGEALVLGDNGVPDFPALVAALEKNNEQAITSVVFDLLQLDGVDFRSQPYTVRKRKLQKLLGDSPTMKYGDYIVGNGDKLLAQVSAAGGEGLIAKNVDAPYRSGRQSSWLKIKTDTRSDVFVLGYMPSQKGETFASLLAGIDTSDGLTYVGRIGTGFDRAKRKTLEPLLEQKVQAPPKLSNPGKLPKGGSYIKTPFAAEVRHGGWTGDGQLRQARFIALQADRLPETREPVKVTRKSQARKTSSSSLWTVTHPDRVIFPDAGITKGEIASYYEKVWPAIEPHLKGRPVSLLRVPEAIDKETFFQRHPLKGMQKGLNVFGPAKEQYFSLDGEEGLRTAVQFGAVELHGWNAVLPDLDAPDRMVFDLDPDEALPFSSVIAGAEMLKGYLRAAGLESWPLLSGGKGIHVVVPLSRQNEAKDIEFFCSAFSKKLALEHPKDFVATISKAKRTGKVLIDYLRNRKKATAILPWSLRARPGATIAAPVTWNDLGTFSSARAFDITHLPSENAWTGFFKCRQSIAKDILSLLRRT